MTKPARRPSVLLAMAAFVVVVAGMRAAQSLLVPFLLALFIAVIASPALTWLRGRGLPMPVALLLVFAVIFGALAGVGGLVLQSATDFNAQLPGYAERLDQTLDPWIDRAQAHGVAITDPWADQLLDPAVLVNFGRRVLAQLGNLVASSLLILATVLFILFEAASFTDKVTVASQGSDVSVQRLKAMAENLNRYMALKTLISLVTGVLAGLLLLAMGVSYPLLWGLLAFLLNFVPNIGSILAGLPPVLLALVQHGGGSALGVLLGYAVINVVMGSLLEPKILGKGLGLSTLVVFLSLIFWGWVLGPMGMLLSVPLTMALKIALEGNPDTRWVAVMLSSGAGAKEEVRRTMEIRRPPEFGPG